MDAFDGKNFFERLNETLFPTLSYRSIEKDYSAPENTNEKLCSKCGGRCCKECGCHFSPDDFKEISFEFLKSKLEKGYISIDYVDREIIYDDFGCYILRARNTNAPIVDLGLDRTPCILLKESGGCKLNYDDRPSGGKLLIPKIKVCTSNYTIKDCCYEWKPHQKILHDLVKYFKDKDFPCSL